jgi:hypothetical protein
MKKYRHILNKLTILVYSIAFALLLANHLNHFSEKYFKFGSSVLVNKYHLQYFYIFMIFFEALTLFVYFILLYKRVRLIYDILAVVYFSFSIAFLLFIDTLTNGCLDCHYISSFFNENYKTTLYCTIGLVLLYFLVIRAKKPTANSSICASGG